MKTVKRTTDRALLFSTLLFLIVSLLGLAPPTEAGPKTAVSPRGNCVEGEVLVVFKNKIGEISAKSVAAAASEGGYLHAAARTVGASAVRSYSSLSSESDSLITLFRSETKTTDQLMAELKKNPDVLSASPNRIVRALSASEARPNDARCGELWGMEMINAPAAWAVTSGDFTGEVYVAVIDSGIAKDHEDLKDNIAFEYCRNFASEDETAWKDDMGHGTHVAGTIGAVGNNGVGVAGVNWKTKIIALRVFDDNNYASDASEIAALDYLTELLRRPNPPKIAAVNLSLGEYKDVIPEEYVNSPESLAFRALDRLPNAPVIVVAAGNDGMEVGAPAPVDVTRGEGDETEYFVHRGWYAYPASLSGINNMIVVGSVASTDVFTPLGKASYFSNWSSKYVQLAAPGGTGKENASQDILSVSHADADGKKADNEYVYMSGTSMAAPHVTGAAALLASRYPDLNAARLKSHLLVTANHDFNPETDHVTIDPPERGLNIERQKAPDYKLSKYGLLNIGKAVTTPPAEIPLQSVTLTAPDVSECEEGDVFFLLPAFEPEEATGDRALTWKSSNPDAASVTRNTGMVTVMKTPGRTTITAATSDGKISGAVELTFGDPEPEPAPPKKGGGGCSAAWPGAIGFIIVMVLRSGLRGRRGGGMSAFFAILVIFSALSVFCAFFVSPAFASAKSAPYVEGEVLVVFKNKVGEINARSLTAAASEGGYLHSAARTVGASAVRSYSSLSAKSDALITLFRSDTKTTEQLMEDLKKNPDVLSVSPNRIVYTASLSEARPDDARYGELWGMEMINAPAAWAVTSGDFAGEVYVAVIDSGIVTNHEDLKGNIAFEYCRNFASGGETACEDVDGHGSHVAGTIGAVGNNGIGIAGVNWKTKIIALRTFDENGAGSWSYIIAALDFLVKLLESPNPPRIAAVNMSLGSMWSDSPEIVGLDPLYLAIRALDRLPNGPLIVVAASNEGVEVGAPATVDLTWGEGDESRYLARKGDYAYPASFLGLSGMIVVGSVGASYNPGGRASYFSNWSSKYVQLAAPGGTGKGNASQNILSTWHRDADGNKVDNSYIFLHGTSMAAPHVTGAAALLASRYPDLNAARLKSHLLVTANHNYNPETDHVAIASPDKGRNIERQKAPDYKLSKYGLLDIGKAVTTPPAEIPFQGVTLAAPDVSEYGEEDVFFLLPTFEPEEATEDRVLTWKSSNADVASVTPNTGMVTVLRAPGRTTITASTPDGKISGAVELTFGDRESAPTEKGGGGGCSAAWPCAIGFIFIVMVLRSVLRGRCGGGLSVFFAVLAIFSALSVFFAGPAFASAKSAPYVEGEVLVVFRNRIGEINANSLAAAASEGGFLHAAALSVGASVVRSYSSLSAENDVLITLFRSGTKTTEQLMKELKKNPDVLSVSPNRIVHPLSPPEPRLQRKTTVLQFCLTG